MRRIGVVLPKLIRLNSPGRMKPPARPPLHSDPISSSAWTAPVPSAPGLETLRLSQSARKALARPAGTSDSLSLLDTALAPYGVSHPRVPAGGFSCCFFFLGKKKRGSPRRGGAALCCIFFSARARALLALPPAS